MTKTDFSVLAAPKSQTSGPARTGGLMDGDGAFLAYLGQETVKKQSRDPLSTLHATYPQSVEPSFAPADGMIRTANKQTEQSGAEPLPMAEGRLNFDLPANGLSPANPQIADPDLTNLADESAVQIDDAMLNAISARLGAETPAQSLIHSPKDGIATAQPPTAPPHGPGLAMAEPSKAFRNGVQQTDTLDEQTLENVMLGQSYSEAGSRSAAKTSEQMSPTTSQPHASSTDNSTSAPASTLSSTFAKRHAFQTSELAQSDNGESKAQQTTKLQRLGDNSPINAGPAAALASPKTGLGGELPPVNVPAEFDAVTNTKATAIDQALLTQGTVSRITSLPSSLEKAQQNINQIAPQIAQSAPTRESEILKPQLARYGTDVSLTPSRAEPQDSAVPLAQGLGVQVRTLLQPPPQQTGAIQTAPPVVQDGPDKRGPETAVNSTSIARTKSPDMAIAPIGDPSDPAQYSEKKSLYGSVFASTGFSTTTTSSTTQAFNVQPNAVPVSAIAEQIKAHSTAGKPSTIELTLTPEDLGKIRLVMVPEGDKIRIVVHTDRPETLDLIRRNTDAFSADLRQAGYSNASFSFSGWNGRQTDHQNQHSSNPNYDLPADDAQPSPATPKPQASQPKLGGLNLRV
ncbi:flagellar hook-length control protein FliK [Pseudorhodobacter sp. W20_MBD10_FR17]|uniref:flagellar hook-length control protein FliK n=1 Tax=Pseudorhodobacter sp. W20_MBD10_FR17 TaxID=3240266 RepID=UPI003F976B2C